MTRQSYLIDYLEMYGRAVIDTIQQLSWANVAGIVHILHQARLRGAYVFVCGNGGSAATASHLVNDLNKGANVPYVPRFRAIGLGDNTPLLTAWSNDESYADIFVEPLRNLARPEDVLVGISCSGNSENVLRAMRFARELGMLTIGLTGSPEGKLANLAQIVVTVPGPCIEHVEDVHMCLAHAIVSALRDLAQQEMREAEAANVAI